MRRRSIGTHGVCLMCNRHMSTVPYCDDTRGLLKRRGDAVTRRRGHVRCRTGVHVPVRRTRWRLWLAGRLQCGVEGAVVEDVRRRADGWNAVVVARVHRLLGLEWWARSQNARARGTEGHRPSLDHALPWMIAGRPGCVRVVGVRRSTAVAAAAFLVETVATTAVVVAVGAAAVGVGGAVGGRCRG